MIEMIPSRNIMVLILILITSVHFGKKTPPAPHISDSLHIYKGEIKSTKLMTELVLK